jgi:hypothetical protein
MKSSFNTIILVDLLLFTLVLSKSEIERPRRKNHKSAHRIAPRVDAGGPHAYRAKQCVLQGCSG